MNSRRMIRSFFLPVLLGTMMLGIFSGPVDAGDRIVYNKYNIHVQDQIDRKGNHHYAASYANYTDPGAGHMIIPAGTPLIVKKKSRKEIVFLTQKDNLRIEFEYHEPRMGMSVDKYLELITSSEPTSLSKFSGADLKGIEGGKAQVGMTKEGILTALGYPAAHRTPSLDAGTWIYWTNRFGTLSVDFDAKGKVTKVTN